MAVPSNALELFDQYQQQIQQDEQHASIISNTQVMLVRFLVPALGGPLPRSSRASQSEISQAKEYLKTIALEQLGAASQILEAFFTQKKLTGKVCRNPRLYLNKLLKFGIEQGWVSDPNTSPVPSSPPYSFRRPKERRGIYSHNVRVTGKKQKPPYRLGTYPEDFWQGDKAVLANPKLNNQLLEFSQFLQQRLGVREATAEKDIISIRRILGWFVRYRNKNQDPGVLLSQLQLEMIIPVIHLRLSLKEFKNASGSVDRDKYSLAKLESRETAKEAAKECYRLIEDFLDFFSEVPSSRAQVLKGVINLAKFLYKDETDPEETEDFGDIPVIRTLRRRRREVTKKAEDTPNVVPYEVKSLPWPEVLGVLKMLQKEVDVPVICHKDSSVKAGSRFRNRNATAIAKSLQRFLILAFMTLIPPDRQRALRELKLSNVPQGRGTYLLHGVFEKGIFVPIERLENPQAAQWWIYQNHYKTSRFHGVFQGRIENYQLGERSFYDYIDVWVNQYRVTLNPTHDCFFTGVKGQPFQASTLGSIVRSFFVRFTGVPVTPHVLRHSYSTYLQDQEASPAVRQAAAIWMKHSEMMQAGRYNHSSLQKRLEPIYEFNQQIIGQVFS